MEQSPCTESLDSSSVSCPPLELTVFEACGTLLITKKEGYWIHYMFHRWLVGYKKVISPALQQIYIPNAGIVSGKVISQCQELARYYTAQEQERIWKWTKQKQDKNS